jgi:uncharacterized membrane protein YgaE (UPF0421/DUF939 family)
MSSLCPSGLLIGTLTLSLLIGDFLYMNTDRLVPHFFLGGLATALCFLLCQNGYEIISITVILIIPVYMFVSYLGNQTALAEKINSGYLDEKDTYVCKYS